MLVDTSASRPVFMATIRHLFVDGNALLYFALDGGPPRMFRMDQYVVLRDERGSMLEAVIHERVYPSALSDEVIATCKIEVEKGKENDKLVDLYTHVKRVGDDIVHYQEINGIIVPERSEEHTSELQSLMRISYAVFCLIKQKYHHY